MFLEILWSLEGLAAEATSMRLQGNMNSNVRGDVVTLDGSSTTSAPPTDEIEVIRTLATDMTLADMILEDTLTISSDADIISVVVVSMSPSRCSVTRESN